MDSNAHINPRSIEKLLIPQTLTKDNLLRRSNLQP